MLAVKTKDVPSQNGPHFGLDVGLVNLAVLSGRGVVKFDCNALRHTRRQYLRYRQALQKKRKTGMIKRGKGRESRWVKCENHHVSRQNVDTVAASGGILHIEELPGIRDRTKETRNVGRILHVWPFAQLLALIRYKASLAGVVVIEEDPRHTSQQCNRSLHRERGNRPSQGAFWCKACSYKMHAGVDAACNLAARGTCSPGAPDVTPGLRLERGRPVGRPGLLQPLDFHLGSRRI